MEQKEIIEEIIVERQRQNLKWGEQNHDGTWLLILTEELGEASKNIIENAPEKLTDQELIQSAAVIVQWLESRGRRNNV